MEEWMELNWRKEKNHYNVRERKKERMRKLLNSNERNRRNSGGNEREYNKEVYYKIKKEKGKYWHFREGVMDRADEEITGILKNYLFE